MTVVKAEAIVDLAIVWQASSLSSSYQMDDEDVRDSFQKPATTMSTARPGLAKSGVKSVASS